jgi:ribonuclease Z
MQGFDNRSGRQMDAARECEDSKLSTTKGPEVLRTCEPRLNLDTDFLDLRTAFKALEPRLLGSPGFDNALYVTANTGKTTHRFLFDCGANCLTSLSPAEVQKIDVIFFSHLHFDHVAGFDYFLRFNFDRAKPVHIFGPPRTAEIMHNRLQGVMWDRVGGSDGKIFISEIGDDSLSTFVVRSSDGFRSMESVGSKKMEGVVLDTPDLSVRALSLDHGTPSIAYVLATKAAQSVDTDKMKELNLTPGPWVRLLKDMALSPDESVEIGGVSRSLGELRAALLVEKPEERIGYLTDFRLDDEKLPTLVSTFRGCDVLVCENNYRDEHVDLARKNFHVTSSQVGRLAQEVNPKNLVLFHLSDRYEKGEWAEQLSDVRGGHQKSYFPAEWRSTWSAENGYSDVGQAQGVPMLSDRERGILTRLREDKEDAIVEDQFTNALLDTVSSDQMFFGIKIADLDFMREERVDLERINRFQNLESLCLLNVGSSVGSFGKDKLGSLQSFEMYDWKELKDLSFLAGAGAALTKYTVDSCPQLQSLEGMEHLTKLKELTIFNCAELKEISAVRHLESLEELNLALLPSLTDLSALYSLKRLALVRISRDTPVSAKDLRALKKELPKCKIEAC